MSGQKKLLFQLFPSFLIITFASLAVVTWYILATLHNFFVEQTREDLLARARLVKHYIATQTASTEISAIHRICREAGERSGTRLTIIRPTGEVIGDTQKNPHGLDNHAKRTEVAAAIQSGQGSAIRYSNTLQKKMMYVAIPLEKNNQVKLIIRAAIPLSSIYNALATVKTQILAVGMIVALVVVVVSFLISRKIVRPVQEMKKGADRFAAGELDRKLALPDTLELAGLAAALNDMATKLDQNIKTIKRQKNEIETVFGSMTEAVIAIDKKEKILRINHAAEYFLGYRETEVQGKYLYEIIRNHDFTRFAEAAANTATTAQTTEGDIVFEINDQNYIVNTQSAPLIDESQQRIGTLLVLNDVTRIRRLENMRKEFAANVSHEIKTPLTAIQGFTEELLAEPALAENKVARRYLDIIVKNARRLSAIVEDVLRLSNIEHGNKQKDFHFENTKLAAVIDSAMNICKPEATQRGMRITADCDPTLIACLDFSLMEQALVNLLGNALKYSPDKSEIHISAAATGEEIRIQIRDSGIGIDKKHIPRLFERFYRVDKNRSRKLGGTGLGLAIVKHVVQIHEGKITVDSTPGQGSVFTVTLPRP